MLVGGHVHSEQTKEFPFVRVHIRGFLHYSVKQRLAEFVYTFYVVVIWTRGVFQLPFLYPGLIL